MTLFQEDMMMTLFQEGGKQASVGDQVAETLHWDLSVEADAGGKIGLFFTIIKLNYSCGIR